MKRLVIGLVVMASVATACGDDPAGHSHGGGGGHQHDAAPIAFGRAADPDDADRTVVVTATELKFRPASIEVESGETVTFEVTNEDQTDHEFVLGDERYQNAHGKTMGEMHHSERNGVFLEPGVTDTVTWTFTKRREVLFACHVNGHYEAGMFGRIRVR